MLIAPILPSNEQLVQARMLDAKGDARVVVAMQRILDQPEEAPWLGWVCILEVLNRVIVFKLAVPLAVGVDVGIAFSLRPISGISSS